MIDPEISMLTRKRFTMTRRSFVVGTLTIAGAAVGESWVERMLRAPGRVERLGVPVHIGLLHEDRVGPPAAPSTSSVYMSFAQANGALPFLLVVDPDTGATRQYFTSRQIEGLNAMYPGADGNMYIAGYKETALFRFDPRRPADGLQELGVLPGANMIWWLREAGDGRLYMTTSDAKQGARVFSWERTTNAISDLGPIGGENTYATHMQVSEDGSRLYIAVGQEKCDVIAYDIRTGKHEGLLREADRIAGDALGLFRDDKGLLVAHYEVARREIHLGLPVNAGPPPHDFPDGRSESATAEVVTIKAKDGGLRRIPLKYDAGSQIFMIHAGPGTKLYPSTQSPLRLCVYDSRTAELSVLGNPFVNANGAIGAAANVNGRVVFAAYPRSELVLYDPSRPWNPGSSAFNNPWQWGEVQGDGHTRPMAVVPGIDGFVYVGSDSAYGIPGGAMACVDPRTGTTRYNVRDPFLTMSVQTLASDPVRAVVYIGTSTPDAQGTGKGAHVLAWDAGRRTVLWDVVPAADGDYIASLNFVAGKLCGTTRNTALQQRFFALDPATGRTMHIAPTSVGPVELGNLRVGPDGMLYGLSYVYRALFQVDPDTYEIEELIKVRQADGYAMAVTEDGIYYAAGAALMRFRFDTPLKPPKTK